MKVFMSTWQEEKVDTGLLMKTHIRLSFTNYRFTY